MTIRTLFHKYREFILYVSWGVLTTVVNYSVFYLCNPLLDDHYIAINVLAWVVSALFAFWSNKTFVFESKSWKPAVALPELGMFMGARLFSLGLETLLLWLCVENELLSVQIAKLLASVLVVILNYVFSKVFIFHKENQHG